MNPNNLTVNEANKEAAQVHATAHELDILVSKTRENNMKRDRDIERLHAVLENVEERLAE